MTLQAVWALVLLLVEAAAMVYMTHTWVLSTLAVCLGAFGVWGRFVWDLSPRSRWAASLALLAVMFIKWLVVPYAPPGPTLTVPGALSYVVAQGLILFQVGLLFIRTKGRISPIYPALGAFAMVCMGAVVMPSEAHLRFGALSLLYAMVIPLYYSASSQRKQSGEAAHPAGRWLIVSISLALAFLLSATVATASYRYQRQLDQAFLKLIQPGSAPVSAAGFSGQARLGSVSSMKGGAPLSVSLRVYSDTPPGYLRGRAYTKFNGLTWSVDAGQTSLAPPPGPVDGMAAGALRGNLFLVGEADAGKLEALDTRPTRDYRGVLFAPLNTAYVGAPVPELLMNEDGNLDGGFVLQTRPYVTFRAADPAGATGNRAAPPAGEMLQSRLEVPEDLDPRIRRLAEEVFEGCDTTASKLAAVERHFIANYAYSMGITIPAGEDPLTYFLLEKPQAHCEYFAAGSTMLLRLAGVPSRYVTGFVATELNRYGGYYMARNKDAHAWVEAYDVERGAWFIVESTPPAGRPEGDRPMALTQFWDFLKESARELAAAFGSDMRHFFSVLGRVALGTLAFLVTSAAGWLLILALGLWAWRRFRKRPRRMPPTPQPPHVVTLHALLARMDQQMRTHGLTRQPTETVHQFAQRIAAVPQEGLDTPRIQTRYEQYAAVRYQGPPDADTLDALRRKMPI